MEIVRGPQTVPNATIGGSARFECVIDSDSVLPRWNINGYGYTITHLPDGFYFENNFHSKVLIINPVQQKMNNTIIYCYLEFFNGRVERSTQAELIIQPLTPSYSLLTSSVLPTIDCSEPSITAYAHGYMSRKIPLYRDNVSSENDIPQYLISKVSNYIYCSY